MRVLLIEPEQRPVVTEIAGSLESMQAVVGGTIQAIYPFEDDVALICNDDGKLLGLPLNRALYLPDGKTLYDIISGTFFICGIRDDDFISLTDEYIQTYTRRFAMPELFLGHNGKIVVVPVKYVG